MPRKLRLEYKGAVYHVMNRGDRREDIFLGPADRLLFLETLSESCLKTGWQVYAYLNQPRQRPGWLRVDRLFGEWAIAEDSKAGRREFESCMEERKRQEEAEQNEDWKALRRGWCLGPKEFREQLMEQ